MLQVCIKAIWVHEGHMHQDMYLFLKLNRGAFRVQNDNNHRNYKHVSRIMKLIHSSTRECHMGSQTPTSWLHHSSFIRSHIIQMLLSLILLYILVDAIFCGQHSRLLYHKSHPCSIDTYCVQFIDSSRAACRFD